jgi:hypothetical protein
MIEYALVAGFTSVGVDVLLLGPVPTPAVAMLTRSMRSDLGVMISGGDRLRRSRKIDVRIIEFDRQARKIAARVNSRVANRASELKSGGVSLPMTTRWR